MGAVGDPETGYIGYGEPTRRIKIFAEIVFRTGLAVLYVTLRVGQNAQKPAGFGCKWVIFSIAGAEQPPDRPS
jgi:hypothetical protein